MKYLIPTVLILHGVLLRAACPTPTDMYAWADFSSVTYAFAVGVGGPLPDSFNPLAWGTLGSAQTGINSATSTWTTQNSFVNTSSVSFSLSTGTQPYRFFAYQVNYPGSFSDPQVGAVTAMFTIGGTDLIGQANTTFYYGGFNNMYMYTPLSISASNYDVFMVKSPMHEIGHTMGLADNTTATSQQSIMGPQSGTNDIGDYYPSSPTTCDNQSLPIF